MLASPYWPRAVIKGIRIPEDQTRASGNEVLIAHIPLYCPVWFSWSCYAAVPPDRWRLECWTAFPWLQMLHAPCPGCTSDRARNPCRFQPNRSFAKTSLTRRASAYQQYYCEGTRRGVKKVIWPSAEFGRVKYMVHSLVNLTFPPKATRSTGRSFHNKNINRVFPSCAYNRKYAETKIKP